MELISPTLYVPGKYMYVADPLSRAYLDEPPSEQELSDDRDVIVHSLVERLAVTKEQPNRGQVACQCYVVAM